MGRFIKVGLGINDNTEQNQETLSNYQQYYKDLGDTFLVFLEDSEDSNLTFESRRFQGIDVAFSVLEENKTSSQIPVLTGRKPRGRHNN